MTPASAARKTRIIATPSIVNGQLVCQARCRRVLPGSPVRSPSCVPAIEGSFLFTLAAEICVPLLSASRERSEEHTSELQSHLNLVCRLLLEKKKTTHS